MWGVFARETASCLYVLTTGTHQQWAWFIPNCLLMTQSRRLASLRVASPLSTTSHFTNWWGSPLTPTTRQIHTFEKVVFKWRSAVQVGLTTYTHQTRRVSCVKRFVSVQFCFVFNFFLHTVRILWFWLISKNFIWFRIASYISLMHWVPSVI